jgi:uncharacterized protein (UPF0305 family)
MKKNSIALLVILAVLSVAPLARAEEGKQDGRGGLKAFLGIDAGVRTGRDHPEDEQKSANRMEDRRAVDVRVDANADAKLTTKERAVAEIDRRIDSMNKLTTRIDAMKRVSDSSKASIKATVKAEIDALTTLKAKIQADTDEATLKADIASITKGYRIYMLVMPQLSILSGADRLTTTAELMTTLGSKLETRINEAKASGKDVTALTTAYADMQTQISEAKANAAAAITLSASLKPDNGDKTVQDANRKALTDARAKLKAGHDDLKAARKDVETIIKGLKALNVDVKADLKAAREDR